MYGNPYAPPSYGPSSPYGGSVTTTPSQGGGGGGLLGGLPAGSGSIPSILNNGYGAFGGGGSSMAGPAFWAAMIGIGKNLESSHPHTALGQGLLAGLAPSISQIRKDPVGMGLPTLFGMPFLTPLTSSKAAQETKPEWQSLFPLGS